MKYQIRYNKKTHHWELYNSINLIKSYKTYITCLRDSKKFCFETSSELFVYDKDNSLLLLLDYNNLENGKK